jgi:hypothetical protein
MVPIGMREKIRVARAMMASGDKAMAVNVRCRYDIQRDERISEETSEERCLVCWLVGIWRKLCRVRAREH